MDLSKIESIDRIQWNWFFKNFFEAENFIKRYSFISKYPRLVDLVFGSCFAVQMDLMLLIFDTQVLYLNN